VYANCRLPDEHSPIAMLAPWEAQDEVRVVCTKRPCERTEVTAKLPDGNFLRRAQCGDSALANQGFKARRAMVLRDG
jgi:SH3-like domain-containing protein